MGLMDRFYKRVASKMPVKYLPVAKMIDEPERKMDIRLYLGEYRRYAPFINSHNCYKRRKG